MAEPGASPRSVEAGYELSDLSPKNIAIFALILTAAIVLVVFVTYAMVRHFHSAQISGDLTTAYPQGREPVPRPRFWVTPAEQLKAMRAEEEKILDSYSWVDKQKGIARIPIDKAMELVAEKNSRQQAASSRQ